VKGLPLTSAAVAPEGGWYAAPLPSGPHDGESVFESRGAPAAVDSVTWGFFPGKETVTPAIVEEVSYRAWVNEAFGIWAEWRRCYAPDSAGRRALKHERGNCWLVNVISHGYREEKRLWEILDEGLVMLESNGPRGLKFKVPDKMFYLGNVLWYAIRLVSAYARRHLSW